MASLRHDLAPRLQRRKRILFTSLALVATLLMSGFMLDRFLLQQASLQVEARASQFMDTMLAVREYTSKDVNPIIAPLNQSGDRFLPEAVPSYSATKVYSYLHAMPGYRHYSYREATLNPTNLKDKADPFEARLVEIFRADPSLRIQSGERQATAGPLHYVARPITVSKSSCLVCHSTPDKAPRSQLATYGTISGFGWELGEIVGAQIVSVPAQEILEAKDQGLVRIFAMFFFSLALVAVLLILLLPQLLPGLSRRGGDARQG